MNLNLRTLGPFEARVVLSLLEEGRTVVRPGDVKRILGSETTSRSVVRGLVSKGWLARVIGGRYMLLPPEYGPENVGENNVLAMAAAAVDPSYIGWWSAASWHGFTTQRPMTVFVATKRQVPSKVIEGSDVRFVTVTERKFFGFGNYDVYGRDVAISAPAKTVVDCVDRPDLCGGASELTRIVHAALAEVDPKDLLDAAMRLKSKVVMQRLGFLADLVGSPLPDDVRAIMRAAIPSSQRSVFGRHERRDGDIGYVSSWGLFVNARKADLLAEVLAPRSLN
jgi:predicted transcriptional regulator of viral defense system